jgi:hypothetical protein
MCDDYRTAAPSAPQGEGSHHFGAILRMRRISSDVILRMRRATCFPSRLHTQSTGTACDSSISPRNSWSGTMNALENEFLFHF